MNILKYLRNFAFATTFILCCSCNDELDKSFDGSELTSVMMQASHFISDINNTRTILTPTENGTAFSWKIGDIVAVYSEYKGMTNFYIDDESISDDGTSANFNGSGFKLLENNNYYAFYPYSSSVQTLDKKAITTSYLGQEMKSNGDFSSLGDYDYMYAKNNTNNSGAVAFSFQHLGCIVEYKLAVPQTANYSKVRFELSESEKSICHGGIVDITAEIPCIESESSDSLMTVYLNKDGGGIKVTKDSVLTVYMMMSPQDLSGEKIIIRLVDNDNNWYTAKSTGKNMRAGYTYHYEVNNTTGGFTGSGTGLPNDELSVELVSTYTHATKLGYEGMVLDGNILYTTGQFGVRAIDYSNENTPFLIKSVDLKSLTNNRTDMLARSIAVKDDYLYVSMRQTSTGPNEYATPVVKLGFENDLGNYNDIPIENGISSNDTINAFFKTLRLNSINFNQKFKVLYLYKGFYQNGYYLNTINLQAEDGTSAVLFRETFETREEALASLKNEYRNSKGDYCEVDWSALPQYHNVFRNVEFYNIGGLDTYRHTGTASISSSTNACPNTGNHSILMDSGNGTAHNSAFLITSSLSNTYEDGYLSFWFKVEDFSSQNVEIPLTGLSGKNVMSLIINPIGNDNFLIGLKANDDSCIGETVFNTNNWYNIKIEITPSSIALLQRNKESGTWMKNVSLTLTNSNNISYNQLMAGICTNGNNTRIYFDDYYFNETDIDDVSYINGKLAILDKRTLEIIQIYNLDVKAIDTQIYDNRLVVTCFYGFNVYDITDASNPKLTYAYRVDSFKESQNCAIYEYGGKVYAFICNYSQGYTIADITDVNNVSIVCVNDYKSITYNGNNLYNIIYNFDVYIDYPFAYLTNATMRNYLYSDSDRRGIMTINLSDFNNPDPHFSFVESDLITSVTYGDPRPTHIARTGNHLLINNTEKGFLVFEIGNDGIPSYKTSVTVPGRPSVNDIYVPLDGRIFINDNDHGGTEYPDRNIYLYKGF